MTTELEQEFYKTFEIEPISKWHKCKDYSCVCCDEYDNCSKREFIYPEIAAEKLLKMEDILLRNHTQIEYCFYDGNYYSSCTIALCNGKSDNKKDAFLEMLISIAQNFLDNCDTDGEEEIYKQIQQLFKEEEWLIK